MDKRTIIWAFCTCLGIYYVVRALASVWPVMTVSRQLGGIEISSTVGSMTWGMIIVTLVIGAALILRAGWLATTITARDE